jgi:hypothetical protein
MWYCADKEIRIGGLAGRKKPSCCAPDALGQPDASAKLGYSDSDLAAVPEGANMGSGCVAGAIPAEDVEALLHEIGFVEIAVEVKQESREFIKDWFPGSGLEEHVQSAEITGPQTDRLRMPRINAGPGKAGP